MADTSKTSGVTYASLRQELDDTVARLQDPECDVDEAAGLYEQALQSIAKLEQYLEAAANRVQQAQADFASEAPAAGED
jgi:exodeoxyribonuclease VII small subunit